MKKPIEHMKQMIHRVVYFIKTYKLPSVFIAAGAILTIVTMVVLATMDKPVEVLEMEESSDDTSTFSFLEESSEEESSEVSEEESSLEENTEEHASSAETQTTSTTENNNTGGGTHNKQANNNAGGTTNNADNNNNANTGGNTAETPAPARTWAAESGTEQEIFALINQYRQANGIAALPWSNAEASKASNRCEINAKENRTSNLHDFMQIGFYSSGQVNAGTIVNAWKNSSNHNKNLLDTNLVSMGVSVYKDSDGRYWSVVSFDDGW